jgi:hypothetical protein
MDGGREDNTAGSMSPVVMGCKYHGTFLKRLTKEPIQGTMKTYIIYP